MCRDDGTLVTEDGLDSRRVDRARSAQELTVPSDQRDSPTRPRTHPDRLDGVEPELILTGISQMSVDLVVRDPARLS
jgi:hypothetical protein